MERVRSEMNGGYKQLQLERSLLLLVVSLRNDGILLECLKTVIAVKGNVGQLGKLLREQFLFNQVLPVLLKVLFAQISHHSYLLPNQVVSTALSG